MNATPQQGNSLRDISMNEREHGEDKEDWVSFIKMVLK
jgi:hypothetical protein